MRKLIFGINLTMDGCCDHTKGNGGNDEVHEYFAQLMRDADTLLYGRKTYDLMIPFWPVVAKDRSGPTKAIRPTAAERFNSPNILYSLHVSCYH